MPLLTNSYRSTRKRHYLSTITLVILLALVSLAIVNRQNILDWWRLRNYAAPTAISQLASEDTMTPYAVKVFDVNYPGIEDKAVFNKHCPNNGGEQTIVLGCYHSNQAGIYLLNVNDPRLNGVQQVTAAHEMLHAAYDRLSTGDKNKVNAMLLDYYNHGLHDARIISTMAAYKKIEPGSVVNEMHSIFGTEITDLPTSLEEYYSRYFTNRRQIAGFAAQYQAQFTSLQAVVARDEAQLASLKKQIDGLQADLNGKLSSINTQQSQLATLRSGGDTAAYNAGVPSYNRLVDSYNAEIGQLRGLINNYNALVAERNSVALTENQLFQELSGNKSTINH